MALFVDPRNRSGLALLRGKVRRVQDGAHREKLARLKSNAGNALRSVKGTHKLDVCVGDSEILLHIRRSLANLGDVVCGK